MEIVDLIERLDRLRWETHSDLYMAKILLDQLWDEGNIQEKLARYLKTLQYPDPAVTRTAELHSWKLYRTPVWDLALNQFVPYLGESRKASENIHNHTRPLVSLTIAGWYNQNYFRLKEHDCDYLDGTTWKGRIERYDGPATYPGMCYITDMDVFHALTDFQPNTMTLVVYGRVKQDCILCFNQLSGLIERRWTATNAKNKLIGNLLGGK